MNKVEEFEKEVKKKFIEEPGQMKLLIVVDKLLTGFDAPPATYLYIDKQMRDHGLFQAICRVNRLDGDDKEYGYIIDYKDLFKSLEGAVHDYTSGALDGYDKEDVAGLLEDRLGKARERLEEAREAVKALCEPVEPPKDQRPTSATSASKDPATPSSSKRTSRSGWRSTSSSAALRARLRQPRQRDGGSRLQPGRSGSASRRRSTFYEKVRNEVKLHSGDYIDLKMYEPAMRHLIDTYIRAEESEKVSAFDDLSLVQLIVERGADAVKALPEGIRKNKEAVAETIENNVRKLIIDEQPINPKYYEKMSELLDALIEQRRQEALDYQEYLRKIVELTKQVKNPAAGAAYPGVARTRRRSGRCTTTLARMRRWRWRSTRPLRASRQDDWRSNPFKVKKVKIAIKAALNGRRCSGPSGA